MYWVVVLALVVATGRWVVQAKVESSKDGVGGTISFGQDLNDEYDHSMHMPDVLRCDACRVIAYQLTKKFKEAHDKRPSTTKFDESDVMDMADAVCDQKWEGYGIKHMDDVKRLSGEGLDTDELPGVTQAGGQLPGRLREMCLQYTGEVGELAIYESYLAGLQLDAYLCRGTGLRSYCTKSKPQLKNTEKTIKKEL